MATFSIVEAEIVGLFLEALFYGLLLVTFFACLRALLFTAKGGLKRSNDIKWPMVVVTILFAIFGSLDVFFGLVHNLQAFAYSPTHGAESVFTEASDWITIMKVADLNIQTSIGDGILIYRCWVVYGYKWSIIVASLLLWMGNIALGILIIYMIASMNVESVITASDLKPIIYSWWTVTITLNILTTGLIIHRIRTVENQNRRFGVLSATSYASSSKLGEQSSLLYVMRIVIESGLLYTLVALLTFILLIIDSNALYPVSDVHVMVVGIAFNLIIIRAASKRPDESSRGCIKSDVSQNFSVAVSGNQRRAYVHPQLAVSGKDDDVILVKKHVDRV